MTKNTGTIEGSIFDAYIGTFDNDRYNKGIYISKSDTDVFNSYFGCFDEDGKKTDSEAFFYQGKEDRLFFGSVDKDKFVKGYVFQFKQGSTTEIVNMNYFVNDNSKPQIKNIFSQMKNPEYINITDLAIKFCTNFTLIVNFRYFGESNNLDVFEAVYNQFNEGIEKINNKFDNSSFNKGNEISLFDYCTKYYKIFKNYFHDLSKNSIELFKKSESNNEYNNEYENENN